MSSQTKVEELLSHADIVINGTRPWDIKVHEPRLFDSVLASGNLGLGEAYMDGWWDCDSIDEFICKILSAHLDEKISPWRLLPHIVMAKVMNKQSKGRAFEVGEKHYNIGNDLFETMLDARMTYTCAYWKGLEHRTENLDAAQEQKLDLVCKKIGLKKGDHALDIGCGWGSFMKFAAEKYGARCTGLTVSKEQVALGQKRCAGLPIEFRLEDYREHQGSYDHVISLGMFEHVGNKNYRIYMEAVKRLLKPNGLFLLHTIGHNRKTSGVDPWIEKYIFPNGIIPQSSLVASAFEGLFIMEDWHNFGADYDPTLMAWADKFEKAWPELSKGGKYSERFHRMWRYYLLSCAGAFRARSSIELWQIVLSPKGIAGGYSAVR